MVLKRKIVLLNAAFLLGATGLLDTPSAHASLKKDLRSIQEERTDVQKDIDKAAAEINRLQAEQKKQIERIAQLNLAIQDNTKKIEETKIQISQTDAEILKLQEEIAHLTDRIGKQTEILRERAKSYQEYGGNVSYLDVLLGSSSFADLVDRVLAVKTIMEADKEVIGQFESDKKAVEEKKTAVEAKMAELKAIKTELDGMVAQLAEQEEQQKQLVEKLKADEQKNAQVKSALQVKDSELAKQAGRIEQQIKEEEERARRAAERAKREAERAKRESREKEVVYPATPAGESVDVVTIGNRWIGNSVYVFGGGRNQYDIEHGRFDCSSFVHWAFAQTGIKLGPLGSVSTETLKHEGRAVSVSEMKPGDLVFFDTYKKDGHVGIYVGNGKFIGSQSSTGVAIADMNSRYYKERFNGRVRRIL